MRNEPTPSEYLNQGMSPLNSRVLCLFEGLYTLHQNCDMDNLYNSAKFCRASFKCQVKILMNCVAQKGGRGVSKCVKHRL